MNKQNLTSVLLFSGIVAVPYLYYLLEKERYGTFENYLNDVSTRVQLGVESVTTGTIESRVASFIAGIEKFRSRPYPDPPNQSLKYSIGYGHQIIDGDGLTLSSVISQQQGLQLLKSDCEIAISCVSSSVNVQLTDNQFIALASLCYNIGCTNFKSSTLLQYLNSGNYSSAVTEFGRWIYSNGNILQALIDRRNLEKELFLT